MSFVRRGSAGGAAGGGGGVSKAGPNGTMLLSTGVADLDRVIGGGIPVGKLVIVMEDTHAPHHLLLLRYFMAQGLSHAQPLLFGSSSLASPNSFLATLPSQVNRQQLQQQQRSESDRGLRIAWQYHKYGPGGGDDRHEKNNSSECLSYVSAFDLRKGGGGNSSSVECYNFQQSRVDGLLKQSKDFISTRLGTSFGRIAMHSLCAPCMNDSSSNSAGWELLSFVLHLKALIENAKAVALITIPTSLLSSSLSKRWQHLADILVSLQALPEEEHSKTFLDYRETVGLLHVHKLCSSNTQVPTVPESVSYALKIIKKRELVLEQLHLAPVAGAAACNSSTHY